MKLGRKAKAQLYEIAASWEQGEHVLVCGGTGSGKTLLARYLDEIRLNAGGKVVVFICKLQPDATIEKYYPKAQGWVRWTTWKDKPPKNERKVLFYPKVEGLTASEAVAVFRKEMPHALNQISKTGLWTIHLDEGKYMTSAGGVGAGELIGHMFELMRSAKGTMIILAQRPSNLPLTIYSNIDRAFVSRAPNATDVKRLADLDTSIPARELQKMINANGKHDFTYLDIHGGKPPTTINLAQ